MDCSCEADILIEMADDFQRLRFEKTDEALMKARAILEQALILTHKLNKQGVSLSPKQATALRAMFVGIYPKYGE